MVQAIQPSPHQTRRHFEREAIDELARSIQQIGLVQPIKVVKKGERFHLVYGERRLRAIKKLGVKQLMWDSRTSLATLPANGESDLALHTLAENILRNDLSAIEEAEAYLNLLTERDLQTQQQIAELLGLDKRRVSEKLVLLKLPDVVKEEMISRPDFTFRHARALLRLKNEQEQINVFRKVVAEGLTVLQTERLVSEHLGNTASHSIKPSGADQGKLLRRFRRTALQLLDTMKTIAESDETVLREWRRRFGGPKGLATELQRLISQYHQSNTFEPPESSSGETAAFAVDDAIDEMRPAE